MNEGLSRHLDEAGHARMVDVSEKQPSRRRAVAEGAVRLRPATLEALRRGELEKGDALAVARLAAIQGAKRTADLVPLCHPVRLDAVAVEIDTETADNEVVVRVEAAAVDRTGVEMEALVAVAAACLAVYDMVKGIDRAATIESIHLVEKEGGRSGLWRRDAEGAAPDGA